MADRLSTVKHGAGFGCPVANTQTLPMRNGRCEYNLDRLPIGFTASINDPIIITWHNVDHDNARWAGRGMKEYQHSAAVQIA